MMYGYGNGWAFFAMLLFMIVLVAAVVVAAVFVLRGVTMGGQSSPGSTREAPPSPKDVLKRRYAAGEIDREDYLQRLHDLDS
jgi:putative membrane protein